ncbi:MAG: ATP-binding protein [Sneathiella sp.]
MPEQNNLLPDATNDALFWTVFHTSSDLMAITSDKERRHLAVNDAWLRTMQYTADEVIGRSGIEIGIWPGYDVPIQIERAISNGKAFDNLKSVMRSKNNRLIHCILTARAITLNGEKLWLFSSRDVTLNKIADDALLNQQEILIDALESINEGFVLYGQDGGLIVCNSKFREFYGYSEEEARQGAHRQYLGQLDIERKTVLVSEEKEHLYVNRREDLTVGPPEAFEVRLKDGRILMLSDRRTSTGGVVSIQSDITNERKMEEALRRSQKMEAIGQLTGGIAHDFNNILNVILGNLELVEDLATDKPEIGRLTDAALKSVNRGSDLTKKLLSFARTGATTKKRVAVNGLIKNMQALIARSLTASIEVNFQPKEDLWEALIDPGDLEDALLNISLNARDAMPNGGLLTIRTGHYHQSEAHTEKERPPLPGDYIEISVSDTGIGMTTPVREKAFEPFFTTKEQGKGTGLGLSMIYGFAQRSNGHVTIQSEPGSGATVTLYLPRAGGGTETPRNAHTKAVLADGAEKILIVDDEGPLVDVAASILQKLGYRVLTATNANEALQQLEEHPDTDLLFTDVIMPGSLDGFQLAFQARQKHPDLKVLMASGYTRSKEQLENTSSEIVREPAGRLLQKPYTRSVLTEAVRETLDKAL